MLLSLKGNESKGPLVITIIAGNSDDKRVLTKLFTAENVSNAGAEAEDFQIGMKFAEGFGHIRRALDKVEFPDNSIETVMEELEAAGSDPSTQKLRRELIARLLVEMISRMTKTMTISEALKMDSVDTMSSEEIRDRLEKFRARVDATADPAAKKAAEQLLEAITTRVGAGHA